MKKLGTWKKIKQYSAKALDFTARGVKRLDKVGEDNAPKIKRTAKRAIEKGSNIFDTISKAGSNVNKNIERSQASSSPIFDLGFNKPIKKKRKKKHGKGKKIVIYLK